jgi:aspartyl-tRNA(Asn)/glutamyl-tRNA(Gln) amidotransferase subunit C
MSELNAKEIEKIATLARLDLSEEEKARYATELSVVFDYMQLLDEVDTDGVPETCQVTGLEDVVREDVVQEVDEDTKSDLLAQFPNRVGNMLQVPGVFE